MIIPRMSKSFSVIFSHGKHHPAEMVAREITRFRTAPAVDEKVAASIQKQAFSARLFSVPRDPSAGSPLAGRRAPSEA
jgi:hypothetical protein